MKDILALTGLLFILIAVTGCTKEKLSEAELIQHIADSPHLSKSKKHQGFDVSVTFRPTDLIVAQELGREALKDSSHLSSLRRKYRDHYYFTLSLSKNNKEAIYQMPQTDFSEIVQTLSFGMRPYVNMTTSGRDTVVVADYIFSRTYGMGSATMLMFVFDRQKMMDDQWIQFNLREFGMGLGNHNFRFQTDHLESVPELDFSRR